MKLKVKYYKEASDLMGILLDNGYVDIKIKTMSNYPLGNYYIVEYEEEVEE